MRRVLAVLLVVAATAAVWGAPTGGAVVAGGKNTYATRFAPVAHGTTPVFANFDSTARHDVVSVDIDAQSRPLFFTPTIPFGKTAPVEGVENLAPGLWSFSCSIHPFMVGTLVVI